MIARERVVNTLNHLPVDRAPRDLSALPVVERLRADWLREISYRFPPDLEKPGWRYGRGQRECGNPDEPGQYTDAWGCTWDLGVANACATLARSPLADKREMAHYKPPLELLDPSRFERARAEGVTSSRFVLAETETRPVARLRALRGPENALADLASASRDVRHLLATLDEFSCREMELWAASDVDGVAFRDDWVASTALRVSAETWRDLFKPLYREYCRMLHARDKFVFFRANGNITEIFADLVEIGVDAIGADFDAMDVEALAAKYRAKVTFWGGVSLTQNPANILPAAVRAAVRRIRKALDFGRGGLIAQCDWGPGIPFNSLAAFFDEWLRQVPANA